MEVEMSGTASSGKVVSILVPIELQEPMQAFVKAYEEVPRDLADPQQLHRVEEKLAGACDELYSAAMQPVVQQSVAAREPTRWQRSLLVPSWLRMLALPRPMKNQGRRTVQVRLSRGPAISLRVVYYSRNCDRDDPTQRKGCYPALECLGVFDRCSPALASRAAQTVALCGSFAEARYMLQLQGMELNVKTLANLVYRFAARARANLCRVHYQLPGQSSASGLRLVVALDGGRTRLRHNKAGRRRKKSGRHGFHATWREPKLLTIYAIDEKGKKLKTFAPIIDGTFELLEESEEIFIRLRSYLKELAVETVREVIFIGDGAPWVSNRVPNLLKELKIDEDKARVIVDFYHAVEHLKAVAEACKEWSDAERKAWIKKQRKRLYKGGVAKIIEEVAELKGEKVQTEKDYFANRSAQMRYAAFRKAGAPIGSGAVESAMRRIVNLRLKGNGIFWRKENAEHVLLLRCYAKAGRWANLLPLALRSSLLPAA
jgi:hypothetical protein